MASQKDSQEDEPEVSRKCELQGITRDLTLYIMRDEELMGPIILGMDLWWPQESC